MPAAKIGLQPLPCPPLAPTTAVGHPDRSGPAFASVREANAGLRSGGIVADGSLTTHR